MANEFNWHNYDKPGRGVTKEDAAKKTNGFIGFFKIASRNFVKLIYLNILFFFTSLPIITLPLTITGMTKITRDFVREESTGVFADFFITIKKNIKQLLIITFINLFVFGLIGLSFYMYYFHMPSGAANWIYQLALGFLYTVAVLFFFMNFYIYILTLMFNLKIKDIYRNAMILSIAGLTRNLLAGVIVLIFIGLDILAIMKGLYYIYITLTVFFLFSFSSLVVEYITFPVIQKHMIDPYNKLNNIDPSNEIRDEEEKIFSDEIVD